MARPISSLTKLILSIPRDTPVADVIAMAKQEGLTTSAGNVHQVRSKYELAEDGSVVKKGTGKASKKAAKGGKAAKAAAPAPAPAAKPAKPAKAAKSAPKAAKKAAPKKAAPAPAARAPKADSDVEKALKAAAVAMVLAHGVDRAQAVVDNVIASIRSLRIPLSGIPRGPRLPPRRRLPGQSSSHGGAGTVGRRPTRTRRGGHSGAGRYGLSLARIEPEYVKSHELHCVTPLPPTQTPPLGAKPDCAMHMYLIL